MQLANCPKTKQVLTSKNSPKQLLLILFLVFPFISFGQTDFRSGYYITWDNDTIHGFLDFRGAKRNSSVCNFKESLNSDPIQYNPEDIKAYRFDDSKFYVSKKVEINNIEKQVFLEFLINGMADIFYYSGENSMRYFIEGKDGRLVELNNDFKDEYSESGDHYKRESMKYIGVLKATLADCSEVQPDIVHARLNHKSLINLGKKYHDYVCDNEECIVYEKPVPKFKLKVAPFVGVSLIKLSFPEDDFYDNGASFSDFDFNSVIAPTVGFVVNTSVPQLSERLSADLGVNVYQFKTNATFRTSRDIINDLYDAHLEFTSLQTVVAAKYTFPKRKITPSFAIGFASNFFLSKSQNVTIKRYHNEDEIDSKERTDYFPIVTALHGLYTELGSNFTVNNRHIFFTTLKFNLLGNYKGNFANEDVNGIKTKLISANVSFGMYLNSNK